jgi:transcriptional repressor NrdR
LTKKTIILLLFFVNAVYRKHIVVFCSIGNFDVIVERIYITRTLPLASDSIIRTLRAVKHTTVTLMKCPYCGSENLKTLETRDSMSNAVRRRKECGDCGKRFTSYEYVETIELMVKKKDGRSERFDFNKVIRGLQKACEKRPVTMEQVHEVAEHVRQDLMALGRDEVSSRDVGDIVMKYLKKLDRVAYIRFASVYKEFKEPEDFQKLLKEVRA